MPKYAKGTHALGRCGKCGDKRALSDLQKDKHTKGLLVCGACFDIKHPTHRKFDPEDAIALKRPAPDTDDDSGGSTGTSLVTALGFSNYFGGG